MASARARERPSFRCSLTFRVLMRADWVINKTTQPAKVAVEIQYERTRVCRVDEIFIDSVTEAVDHNSRDDQRHDEVEITIDISADLVVIVSAFGGK